MSRVSTIIGTQGPILFGTWQPDKADYPSDGLGELVNAIPLNDGYYGPVKGLVTQSDALSDTATGLYSAKDIQGNAKIFGGTAAALYRLDVSSWTDISKAGGYALGGQEKWDFTRFGNFVIVAGDLATPVQYFDMDGGALFADLATAAPNARVSATVRDFVMLGNTFHADQGTRPDQVWWSAIGNPQDWPIPGTQDAATKLSGRQALADSGAVQAIVSGIGGSDAAVFCEDRIWRATFEGPPTVFRFDAVELEHGAYVGSSVVGVGTVAFYLSRNGFRMFDGAVSHPIGAGLFDEYVLDDLDDANKDRMWATTDSERNLVIWAYPGESNTGGRPNRLLFWNYVTGRAGFGRINVQALAQLQSPGYTLDQLDAFGNMDTLQASLDSRIWAGGSEYLAAIDGNGKLSEFSGATLQADFKTNRAMGNNGGRMFCSGVKPYIDSLDALVALASNQQFGVSTTTGPYIGLAEDGFSPQRLAARTFAVRCRVPAGSEWSKATGFEFRGQPEGLR